MSTIIIFTHYHLLTSTERKGYLRELYEEYHQVNVIDDDDDDIDDHHDGDYGGNYDTTDNVGFKNSSR